MARLKPRFNAAVNRWWICDAGRYGFKFVDDPDRLTRPLRREGEAALPIPWEEAIAAVRAALDGPADRVGVLVSPKMSNEDLFVLRRIVETLGIRQVGFRVPPAEAGDQDDLLIRADKNPNTRGAELMGLDGDTGAILAAARAGRLGTLLVFHHDLLASGWPAAEVREALARVPTVIFAGTNASATSAAAHYVLPSAAWVEREGTFTNFEGRVQRFRTAIEPLGEALADWDWLGRLLVAAGGASAGDRAERWFRALAAAVPAFGALSYQSVGDEGQPT